MTTTERSEAIPLPAEAFESGDLPRESYANPWTVVSIRHADVEGVEGRLDQSTTEEIADAAAGYLGVQSVKS